jgi:hypothetical protein
VFLSGMVVSQIGGMIFDHEGTGPATQLLVNGVGFALLVGIAYTVAWFKAAPWKRRLEPAPALPAPTPVPEPELMALEPLPARRAVA